MAKKNEKEETAEEMYARAEAEEKAETEQKAWDRMGNPNLPVKRQKPEVSASELKRDIEESQRNEDFEKWENARGLSKEKLNTHPTDVFTFGERVKSGVKELASDINLKHTAPGQSVIRNTFDLLASGQFAETKEIRLFSQGISAVKEKVAVERGTPEHPIYGIYPIGGSRNYTKKQTMQSVSHKVQASKAPRATQTTSPVFRNIDNLASTNMDFASPIFRSAPTVTKNGKKPQSGKRGNPYDPGFRI